MNPLWTRLAAVVLLSLGLLLPAAAHTPDISTAKLIAKDGGWTVEEGFLATDLERMFSETMNERPSADLSAPGVLEEEIGKFVQRRVVMKDAAGRPCAGKVEHAGEDPTNQDSALVVLRFSCVGELTVYDAAKLLAAQGPRGKQLVTVTGGSNPGEIMIDGKSPPLDLTKPLQTTWQLMQKFGAAGIEHILTGYDHICFLVAVILWASRVWPVVKIVTAFTISHSITLSLAALDVVTLPTTLTESAIALSIIYVAVENFFSRDTDKRWRDTFLFGFIHGFGFASGLKELNVQQQTIVPALASFNIGVELGQIAIVLALMPVLLLIDRQTGGKRNEKLVYGASAVIALLGAYWLLQRIGVIPA
ncbi:HupE/UreJ family protein [Methylocystis heyeri]|uniref:HupE/UreJ family protein n=1 Tax=Methylocystis heyeri TaxID=391905 RepID=A0A6B8KKS8_9HYPH|nr:HupE/UreJ family protein [Methylocystis heyeri]QGM47288.1 HupE/UreJ family protein [Methylocystis heyeri]